MNKIIIKNCNGLMKNSDGENWCRIHADICENISNCLIKKIAKLCEEDNKPIRTYIERGSCYCGIARNNATVDTAVVEYSRDKHLAENILSLMDISEVIKND